MSPLADLRADRSCQDEPSSLGSDISDKTHRDRADKKTEASILYRGQKRHGGGDILSGGICRLTSAQTAGLQEGRVSGGFGSLIKAIFLAVPCAATNVG